MIAMMGLKSGFLKSDASTTKASSGPDKKKKEKKKQVSTEYFASMKGVDELMQAQGRATKPLSLADLELKLLEVKDLSSYYQAVIQSLSWLMFRGWRGRISGSLISIRKEGIS